MSDNLILCLIVSFIYLIYLLYLNNKYILFIKKEFQNNSILLNSEINFNIKRAATQILFNNLSHELNKEKSLLSFKLVFLGLFNGFSFSFLEMKVSLCFLFFILIYLFSSITLIMHLKVVCNNLSAFLENLDLRN